MTSVLQDPEAFTDGACLSRNGRTAVFNGEVTLTPKKGCVRMVEKNLGSS
ncbi:Uncharacterised protein [Chlamydia trachomatis]|nr:Uncharacterised protein [Chlamydia trachomatis]